MTKNVLKSKADNALRTIGEVSEILGISSHVIRFWQEKFTILKPVKYNNRRYFSSENIKLLEQIKYLLYTENYSIKDAISYLKNSSKKPNPLEKIRDKLLKAKAKLMKFLL